MGNEGITFEDPRRGRAAEHSFATLALCLLAACSAGGSGTGGGGTGGGPGGGGRGGGTGRALNITPAFSVYNEHANPRTETICASIPFPQGMVTSLDGVGVSGRGTAWLPMQRWPDGSVRVAQAQFTDDIGPGEKKDYTVVRDVQALTGPFEQNEWVRLFAADMQFGARVKDTFNVSYEANTSGAGRVVQETFLVRVTHHRLYHRAASGGIGRDYLTSQFYVTEYRDAPFVVVDWILGNDYLGADNPNGSSDPNLYPLGSVDVREAVVRLRGGHELQPYMPQQHAIPTFTQSGAFREFKVMENTHIGDGVTRRYRFFLRAEDPSASAENKARWANTFAAMVDKPFRPLCDLETWQLTEALGLHGGPIHGDSNAFNRAEQSYNDWLNRNHFGTWGSFGDVKNTHTTGTPRNGPMSEEVGFAVQGQNLHLLIVLEQKAWAQAQRPCHLYGLQVGAEQRILLYYPMALSPGNPDITDESLGRRNLFGAGRTDPYRAYRTMVTGSNHDWNGYDIEHWTTDLLFDYWTMSGDAWAREELRQLGESLKATMRLTRYGTAGCQSARAEGWCMVGFVQAYLATGDDAMKTYAIRRIHEVVDRDRLKWHPSRALVQNTPDPRSGLPSNVHFYSVWQHGALLFGYLAAHRFLEDQLALQIAEDVVRMLDYSWVRNYTHPGTGQYVAEAPRYSAPCTIGGTTAIPVNSYDNDPAYGAVFASSPLGSVNIFFVGGLHMLALVTQDQTIEQKALQYGGLILGDINAPGARQNRWFLVLPQDYLP